MGYKEQPTGLVQILLSESLIVQRRNNGLPGTGSRNNQVTRVATNLAFCFQSIQNLLLIRIRRNIHGIYFGIITVEVFFCLQRSGKALLLILRVIFKLTGVPITLKCRSNFINCFGQVLFGYLYIPFQAAGNCSIGKIGRSNIRRGKPGVTVKHVGFCVQAGTLGVVAHLNFGIRQLSQLFNRLYICCPHIGGRNDPQLATVLGELTQLINNQAKTAPLDEGNQHIDTVCGNDFLFQLRIHLGLMDCTGKQGALCNRCLRSAQIRCCLAYSQSRVLFP